MTSRTILDCTLYGSLQCLWQVLFGFVHSCCQSFTLYGLANLLALSQHSFPYQNKIKIKKKPTCLTSLWNLPECLHLCWRFFPEFSWFQDVCRFLHLKLKLPILMASSCSEKLLFVFQPTRTSSESIYSRPGSSIPGSPGHTIYVSIPSGK